jgi:hypothetical protein
MSWYEDVIDELARAQQGELDPARKERARHSLAFRPAELELLRASSETLRLSLEADGWEAAGPHRIR